MAGGSLHVVVLDEDAGFWFIVDSSRVAKIADNREG
jgi:hypothetical protein